MTSLLCPVSPSDPRPSLLDTETIRQAVVHNLEAICGWSRREGYPEADAWVLAKVIEAFVESNAEPSRAVRLMEILHKWKPDLTLRWHFEVIAKNLPRFLTLRVAAWVLRTGMRFPGKPGDLVVFKDQAYQRNGRVLALVPAQAAANVEAENGVKGLIYAEQILENRTNGREGQRVLNHLIADVSVSASVKDAS